MTLDERVSLAIKEVHHTYSAEWPQYIAAFTEKGREEGRHVYGNKYRWLLDEHGKVFRWQRFAFEQPRGEKGKWVPATKRMTKIIRMRVWPRLIF